MSLNHPGRQPDRDAALTRAERRCQHCGSTEQPEPYWTTDGFSEVLCRACYKRRVSAAVQPNAKLYAKVIDAVFASNPDISTVADLSALVKDRLVAGRVPIDAPQLHQALTATAHRLTSRTSRRAERDPSDPPLSRESAAQFIEHLRHRVGSKVAPLAIPPAKPVSPQRTAAARATVMLQQEIVEAIYRCEDLESTLSQEP